MENKAIAKQFKLLAQLMELHGENPFKIKSITNAVFKIDKLANPLALLSSAEISEIEGIGKGISAKISELLSTGTLQELQDLIVKTPLGVVEMLAIKGIGPKKIAVIWKDLGIDTIGELFYACNENRLIEAKGFGLKTQEEIKKAIEFSIASNGRFLYAQIEPYVTLFYNDLAISLNSVDMQAILGIAGQFRRACEIIDELILVLGTAKLEDVNRMFSEDESYTQTEEFPLVWFKTLTNGLKVRVIITTAERFQYDWFMASGSDSHVSQVLPLLPADKFNYPDESAIYEQAGLNFIPAECREGFGELEQAKTQEFPKLIELSDLKGSLHNHSTWSDGVHTLKEMALYCKSELNLEYLGICDHSKVAVYAKGLSIERVLAQHQEIDQLNSELAPFYIFKGIESDILSDGSLDYPEEILKSFDFIVASIHSPLKMDEEKATHRLIKAIENPYTTILGHPTGRLLLSRAGYPIDYKKVIEACAANDVAIEINANPLRLDLDWRWHRFALEKGVKLAINPDAHRKEGFLDMKYGVLVGRKGGLTASYNLNSYTLPELTTYFKDRKVKKGII
ncbi:MAG: DNA polymerase/3'-5' exonuclease PolX [Pedobacter sp.]|nr:MAG: DNA polymerase/3'-5' exonuclease PolX [Pedobacter sp.]